MSILLGIVPLARRIMPSNKPLPDIVCETPHLSLVTRNGWSYVQRRGTTGVVTVVPRTDDDEIVFVEQFRPPVQANVIEFPAGLAGDIEGQESETLETAARRELLEETGYEAGTMRELFSGPSSAGLTDEVITFFLATGLQRVDEGGGDASESILVHCIARTDLGTWLNAKVESGCMLDSRLFSGLYFVGETQPSFLSASE